MSGQIDQTYGSQSQKDRYFDGTGSTVRIVVENDDRPLTALELAEFESLAKAAEDYIAKIREVSS